MNKKLKRLFDIFFSFLLIIFFIPIWIILAIASIIYDKNIQIFYSDLRIFQNLQLYRTIKFRTMSKNANQIINMDDESKKGNHFKNMPLNSNLFTPFGKFLERYQLNETLQFLLIFVGKMSFVGNRPLPINIYDNLKKNFDNVDKIYSCPCGLTGASQVIGKRYLTAKERIFIETLYAELYYSSRKLLKIDFIIIFLTLRLIFSNKYASKEYVINLLNSN